MTEVVKNILSLLKEGDEHISLGEHKDVVLVLGVTGSGKTTLTQHICGDNKNLVSVEVGAGEYIIHDSSDKISKNSTILSKTVFPDLTIDMERGAAFYDCPGFSDTRSTAMDLAASYFIHKVADHVASVKLLFVANYHSVRFGVDRLDFMRLVKHAAEFVNSMDKFGDSIAFIVTKVDNSYIFKKNKPILVSDEKIINNIATFIQQANLSIHELGVNSKPYFSNALKFIEILLTKKDGKYSKIGLFRRPTEDGILSEIELLQEGKRSLQHIIYDNIKFTQKNEKDFGFTISEDSRNNITGVVENINKRIASRMYSVGKDIEEVFLNLELKYSDVLTLREKYSGARECLSEMLTTASKTPDKVRLFENIYKSVMSLGLSNRSSVLDNINYVKQLNFLELVSQAELNIRPLDWMRPFEQLVGHFDDLELWYRFLVDTHSRLNGYELQWDKFKLQIYGFRNQTSHWVDSRERVTMNNMSNFLEGIIENLVTKEYDKIKNLMIDPFRLEKLRDILSLSLKNFISECSEGNELQISGYNIIISKLNFGVCKNVTVIKIFALNKIFVDKDIDKTGNVNIVMVAPYWEVIGDRKIVLDGEEGGGLGKAKDAQELGGVGSPGLPGLPGGNGGHFLAVGHKFKNGRSLLVSASGGRGGAGQDGGRGGTGHDGISPRKETIEQFDREETDNNKLILVVFNKYGYDYKIEGKEGGHGGGGGHGGVGGLGGLAGSIGVVELGDGKAEFILRVMNGSLGSDGKGGSGGLGGRYGNDCKADRSEKNILFFIPVGDSFNSLYCSVSGKRAPSGKYGQDGYNHKGRQHQFPPNQKPNYPSILDIYKKFSSQTPIKVIEDPVTTNLFNKLNEFNQSRLRRDVSFQNSCNHPFGISSASTLNSPINSIILWVRNSLFSLSGLSRLESWWPARTSVEPVVPGAGSTVAYSASAFHLDSSLLLADLLIRKYLTEEKLQGGLARREGDGGGYSHCLAYRYHCDLHEEDLLHQSLLQLTLKH